eukprot:s136_g20.t1
MGRNEVYKSEMLFFHRTDETGEKHYALSLGRRRATEAEDYAARKALHQIRQADSEITRWLSWAASTSKQALELASNEIADARPTDGLSRMWMSRALQEFHGRPIRKFDAWLPLSSQGIMGLRQDEYSGAYHAVLTLPWKASTKRKAPLKYFFEGTGLEPLLAKDDSVLFFGTFVPESAAEAAFKILGPIAKVKRKDGPADLTKPLRDVVSNEKVPAKIRLHQLMEHVLRRTGREPNRRRDFVYTTKPVVENDTEFAQAFFALAFFLKLPKDSLATQGGAEVWQSNTTEVTLTMPSLELDSEPLRYSIRVPSWVRPRKEERMRKLPEASTSPQEEGNPQPSSEQRSEELGAAVRLPVEADSV